MKKIFHFLILGLILLISPFITVQAEPLKNVFITAFVEKESLAFSPAFKAKAVFSPDKLMYRKLSTLDKASSSKNKPFWHPSKIPV